jgi:hypothetical protein
VENVGDRERVKSPVRCLSRENEEKESNICAMQSVELSLRGGTKQKIKKNMKMSLRKQEAR